MKLKCLILNHWWKEFKPYAVETIESPGFIVVSTYQKRECLRCKKEDSIRIACEVVGIDQ